MSRIMALRSGKNKTPRTEWSRGVRYFPEGGGLHAHTSHTSHATHTAHAAAATTVGVFFLIVR